MAKNHVFFLKASDSALMQTASNFLGVDAVTDTTTLKLMFKSVQGKDADDVVQLGFTGTHKEACRALAEALSSNRSLITIADADKGVFLHPFNAIDSITTA